MPDRVSEIISLQLNTFALVIRTGHKADEIRLQWPVHLSFLAAAEMGVPPSMSTCNPRGSSKGKTKGFEQPVNTLLRNRINAHYQIPLESLCIIATRSTWHIRNGKCRIFLASRESQGQKANEFGEEVWMWGNVNHTKVWASIRVRSQGQ